MTTERIVVHSEWSNLQPVKLKDWLQANDLELLVLEEKPGDWWVFTSKEICLSSMWNVRIALGHGPASAVERFCELLSYTQILVSDKWWKSRRVDNRKVRLVP